MRDPVPPVKQTSTFHEIADRFLTSSNNFLPVVDDKNSLVGLVALQDLKEYLNAGQELSGVIAYDVMRPPPTCLTPNQKLLDALPVLMASELRNIPVVSTQKDLKLVGTVARAEALGLLSEAISPRSTPGECTPRSSCRSPNSGKARWPPTVLRSCTVAEFSATKRRLFQGRLNMASARRWSRFSF